MSETMTQKWFESNFPASSEEEIAARELLIKIGERASADLFKDISLDIEEPRTVIAVYAKIFESICEVLASKEDEWDEYCLNFVDRFNIGYTTTDSDDDEKNGNYMAFMQQLEDTHNNLPVDENETDTIELCVQWNAANIKSQVETIRDCAVAGKKNLASTLNIKTEGDEYIIPMFCIIHDALIFTLKERFLEIEEDLIKNDKEPVLSLDIGGLFTVSVRRIDDVPTIFYEPGVPFKLIIKNDALATGKHDED